MALNYFLSLGAHFDIVINIDEFNEVALPPGETFGEKRIPVLPSSVASTSKKSHGLRAAVSTRVYKVL